jgi:hypothetical protein
VATVPRPKNQAQEKSAGHGRKYGEKPSHVIPLWNGILEHRENIGPALWEFVWCIDKITIEDEHGIGWCLGRSAIDTKRIAEDLGEHPDTAYDNLSRLAAEGYIIRKRTPRGYAIGVTNSRKINAFRHLKSDSEKMPNHSETDSEKTPNQSASDSEKTPRVIRSFPESDSEKTPIRRDYAVTLQEDSAERERLSAEEARASDSAEPDQSQRLSLSDPRIALWMIEESIDLASSIRVSRDLILDALALAGVQRPSASVVHAMAQAADAHRAGQSFLTVFQKLWKAKRANDAHRAQLAKRRRKGR